MASANHDEVNIASRVITNVIARFYDEKIKIHVKGYLLDLGCGNVPLYAAYKEYITGNVCVDWENTAHKNDYPDYTTDLNKDLPFKDSAFDTIILSDVLEHIRYPEHLLKEMYRILNNKGKALINVPFYYGLHETPYDYFRYTKYALESMAAASNFNISELHALGGVPEIIADIVSKNIIRLPLIGTCLARCIQSVTWWFINTRYGKKISLKTSQHFPFGYFLVLEKI